MKKTLMIISLVLFSTSITIIPLLSQNDKANLKSFVQEAAEYVKTNGKEKALKEFMNKQGKFHRGELYIFAYDMNGVVIAHGTDPNLVGNNFHGLKDRNGKYLIQEMIKTVKEKGEGYVEYMWFHPQSRMYMKKIGYVMKIDSTWWIGSGIYSDN